MVALFIPLDGRITSQNVLVGPLNGDEVLPIVSPGSAALGNSYQVTTSVLAGYFAFPQLIEVITSGATVLSPYAVDPYDGRVLFNKGVSSASYAVLPTASSMVYPNGVLFKDLKGDAGANNITITFSGGELCDGLSAVVLANAYAWTLIIPKPSGGAWYMGG